MKAIQLILLSLACILIMTSCKDNEQDKLPDGSNKVSEFATIPSVKSMFLALDSNHGPRPMAFSFEETAYAPKDSVDAAFAWGVLFANMQMAVKNRDPGQLRIVLKNMGIISPKLGLEDIITKLRTHVAPMISAGNWQALENTFYNTQYSIEQALFDQARHQTYTLMELGAWAQITGEAARLLSLSHGDHPSAVLFQQGAWQYLEQNLLIMAKDDVPDTSLFERLIAPVREIRACIAGGESHSSKLPNAGRIMDLASCIKKEFTIK